MGSALRTVTIVTGLLACSCGLVRDPHIIRAYDGPERPRSEVAFLVERHSFMPFQSTHVIVQKVDGVQIDNFWISSLRSQGTLFTF
jgi:hypothetical protein